MKLTLGRKLALGFGSILTLMVVSAGITYSKLTSIDARQNRVLDVRVPTVMASESLERDLNWSANKGRQSVLAGAEPAKREEAKKQYDGAWGDMDKVRRWSTDHNNGYSFGRVFEELGRSYRWQTELAALYNVETAIALVVVAGLLTETWVRRIDRKKCTQKVLHV